MAATGKGLTGGTRPTLYALVTLSVSDPYSTILLGAVHNLYNPIIPGSSHLVYIHRHLPLQPIIELTESPGGYLANSCGC